MKSDASLFVFVVDFFFFLLLESDVSTWISRNWMKVSQDTSKGMSPYVLLSWKSYYIFHHFFFFLIEASIVYRLFFLNKVTLKTNADQNFEVINTCKYDKFMETWAILLCVCVCV